MEAVALALHLAVEAEEVLVVIAIVTTAKHQVVAEVLGVPPEQINVVSKWDSKLSPWGIASSNTGNNFHLYDIGAVQGAALQLRERILKLASHVLETLPEELTI